jgi:hypothetical protein
MAGNDYDRVIINGYSFRDVTNRTTGAVHVMTYEEAYRWTLTKQHITSTWSDDRRK